MTKSGPYIKIPYWARIQNEPVILLPSAGENDQDDFSHVRRIKLNIPMQPVDWETNVDQIRSLAMGGSAGGGKSGIVPPHLEHLYNEATNDLKDMDKSSVAKLLTKYGDLFSTNDTDISQTTLVKHSIDTGDARPIKQPPRRVPLAYVEDEKGVIQDMISQGVIRKSTSSWSSPLVLVKKKNGKDKALC